MSNANFSGEAARENKRSTEEPSAAKSAANDGYGQTTVKINKPSKLTYVKLEFTKDNLSDKLIKILFCIGVMSLVNPILALAFHYLFFNDTSYLSLVKMYFFSIYCYFIGATIFEFIVKPCRKKTNRYFSGK